MNKIIDLNKKTHIGLRHGAGFTLIEMIVVVLILGVLAGFSNIARKVI